jgi:phosphomevalonate kinase
MQVNKEIALLFDTLSAAHQQAPSDYAAEIGRCAQLPSSEWGTNGSSSGSGAASTNETLRKLQTAFAQARTLLREMGERAEVPIEPPPQQQLCNATMKLPGILACGVPGAGGYDAVFVIAINTAALANVERLWLGMGEEGQSDGKVCPLLLRAEGCGVGNGIRLEGGTRR